MSCHIWHMLSHSEVKAILITRNTQKQESSQENQTSELCLWRTSKKRGQVNKVLRDVEKRKEGIFQLMFCDSHLSFFLWLPWLFPKWSPSITTIVYSHLLVGTCSFLSVRKRNSTQTMLLIVCVDRVLGLLYE